MVILHFDDELRIERFPFAGALRAPPTRPARRLAGKAAALLNRLAKLLDPRCQIFALLLSERRTETDVMQQAVIVVEPQQQRPQRLRRL